MQRPHHILGKKHRKKHGDRRSGTFLAIADCLLVLDSSIASGC